MVNLCIDRREKGMEEETDAKVVSVSRIRSKELWKSIYLLLSNVPYIYIYIFILNILFHRQTTIKRIIGTD